MLAKKNLPRISSLGTCFVLSLCLSSSVFGAASHVKTHAHAKVAWPTAVEFRASITAGNFFSNKIAVGIDLQGTETEVLEYKTVGGQGNDKAGFIQKIPGRLKYLPITLTFPISSDLSVYKWRQMVENGNVEGARTNATISLFDARGTIIAQYNLIRCWPSKYTGPQFESTSAGSPTESLTIVCDGLTRVQ